MHISSREVFSGLSRAFEDPAPELHWETKSGKMSAQWTARTPEGDRYTIAMRGTWEGGYLRRSLANVTFKERGTPRGGRGRRIASADSFELGVLCASHHYYRVSNGRKTAARKEGGDK